ncbi:MAG: hypothetical protein HYX40_01480 [Sphingobacteriales bacterium]|nr:hypothetical protein [Sphingobacteriales bacterium]
MSGAKIQLSAFETELVQNSEWILTKRSIIDKVQFMFGDLSNQFVAIINNAIITDQLKTSTPKISKGENYYGLPYVVLDYPRFFEKENIFAIRTLFWWGNFFSSTLHLKGKYKELFATALKTKQHIFTREDYAISIAATEWDFRFDENNLKAVKTISPDEWNEIIQTKDFVKFSVKISLANWDNATSELLKYFMLNLKLAGINFPNGEINL